MILPGLKQQCCGHVIASITAGSLVIKRMLSKMGKPGVIRVKAKHTKRMCPYVNTVPHVNPYNKVSEIGLLLPSTYKLSNFPREITFKQCHI